MLRFERCPYEALREVAEWIRLQATTMQQSSQKFHHEAGYIERWCDAVQPRNGISATDDNDGGSGLSLRDVPLSGVAPSHSFRDGGVDDDSDSLGKS